MEKSYIKKGDNYFIKLPDGRLWCPSLQCRGTKYNYVQPSLKNLNDYNARTIDFTAIDFETATTKNRFPCQIGIVVVREGKMKFVYQGLSNHLKIIMINAVSLYIILPHRLQKTSLSFLMFGMI